MTDDRDQASPTGRPTGPSGFAETLSRALDAPQQHAIGLRLAIGGGLAGERYDFDFSTEGDDAAQCAMHCELSERHLERRRFTVEPAQVAGLMRSIAPGMAAALARPEDTSGGTGEVVRQGGFPPCSLIGKLEISIDGQRSAHFFMADAEQARTIGYKPPAFVETAVERIFELAEKRLGMDNVRP